MSLAWSIQQLRAGYIAQGHKHLHGKYKVLSPIPGTKSKNSLSFIFSNLNETLCQNEKGLETHLSMKALDSVLSTGKKKLQ